MLAHPNRITDGDDYRLVVRRGRRVTGNVIIAYVRPLAGDACARFGFIVSKKVGNAVVRNRIRRRLKAACRAHVDAGLVPVEAVFRALPRAAASEWSELSADVDRVLAPFESRFVSDLVR